MIKRITANIALGVALISALVFYTPDAIQPKFGSLGGALKHRISQTNCWGYDEEWDCNTEQRSVPA